MKITLGEKISSPKNAYMVIIETMYGDADGYGEVEVGPFQKDQDEEYLKDLLETCKRMAKAYPHGRGGGDDYNHVEGFNLWFAPDYLSEEEYEALPDRLQSLLSQWENDPQCDGGHASYYGYELFYYDSEGNKYKAKAVL